jgi:hypothetical protein
MNRETMAPFKRGALREWSLCLSYPPNTLCTITLSTGSLVRTPYPLLELRQAYSRRLLNRGGGGGVRIFLVKKEESRDTAHSRKYQENFV